MINISKKITVLLIFLISAAFLTEGCNSNKPVPIVTINDKKLYLNDFLYDIYLVENDGNQNEAYYQKCLGYSYWDFKYNGTTMREIAKNSIMATVVMYEILSDQANKKGMTLSQMEQSDNETAIDQIYSTTSEAFLNNIGLNREVLQETMNEKALGDKYRLELLNGFKIDEDAIRKNIRKEDYREYKTDCLFVPIVKSDKEKLVSLSQEEINSAKETITNALLKLDEGEGFDGILNDYTNLNYLTRNFIYGDSQCEKEYQDAAILLQNDKYSPVITTPYGYYIIHMQDNNSTDMYEEEVEKEIQAEEDSQFTAVYNKLKEQYKITINFDYWNTITVGSITIPKK
ncbi:MAG TPA: hypothetical protein VN258_17510 [Mobilitalea sp.]|nr:hypothetical protein [Mobilitalea sp.]